MRPTPVGCPTRSASSLLAAGIALVDLRHRRDRARGAGPAPASSSSPCRRRWRCSALFVVRCRRVANPLIHLDLFRSQQLPLGQRGHDRLRRRVQRHVPRQRPVPHQGVGLLDPARRPRPSRSARSIVAVTAPMFGRLAGRIGQRRLLVPGGLIWAAGGRGSCCCGRRPRPTTSPSTCRPASAPRSASRSCLPQLSSVAVQGLPADQFGAGSAVVQAVRYVGSTLGVALVVAFTAASVGDDARRLPPRLVAARRLRGRGVARVHPPDTRSSEGRRARDGRDRRPRHRLSCRRPKGDCLPSA